MTSEDSIKELVKLQPLPAIDQTGPPADGQEVSAGEAANRQETKPVLPEGVESGGAARADNENREERQVHRVMNTSFRLPAVSDEEWAKETEVPQDQQWFWRGRSGNRLSLGSGFHPRRAMVIAALFLCFSVAGGILYFHLWERSGANAPSPGLSSGAKQPIGRGSEKEATTLNVPPLDQHQVPAQVSGSAKREPVISATHERPPGVTGRIGRLPARGAQVGARATRTRSALAAKTNTVNVRVYIDAAGKPIKAEIESSTNSFFNQASVEAAMKYTFSPGEPRMVILGFIYR